VLATSDGDVAAHAVCDALLGAAGLGDLGQHFPSSDPQWAGAASLGMLSRVVALAAEVGVVAEFVDVTVVAEDVRVSPHRDAIRQGLASVLGLAQGDVSVKATTTDGLGLIGRGEGIAAMAVVTARHG
jgi:2-C-methyl-D-erythritol 2,4-cyclodiphosphate synthase